MSTGAVILAAGLSQRLGRPKQEVMIGGRSLLQRAVATAIEAGLFPVLVVLRSEVIRPDLRGAQVVWNREAYEGMSSSIRAGIASLESYPGVVGAVVMTCDQPLLTAAHLSALISDPQRVTASAYGQKKGVPAFFPAGLFAKLRTLHGDVGARDLLREAHAIRDEGLALDIDTEADVNEAERRLQAREASADFDGLLP